jgi:putative transposase
MHKLTTRLCRENQTVVIEDLNVSGMLAKSRLARAIADVGFHAFRRQLEYKSVRYGTILVVADRWYPSSKLCSRCGQHYGSLGLGNRVWSCTGCNARHDRDVNAAINLKRLATGVLRDAVCATRGESGDEVGHCHRHDAEGSRESNACQVRVQSTR